MTVSYACELVSKSNAKLLVGFLLGGIIGIQALYSGHIYSLLIMSHSNVIKGLPLLQCLVGSLNLWFL